MFFSPRESLAFLELVARSIKNDHGGERFESKDNLFEQTKTKVAKIILDI